MLDVPDTLRRALADRYRVERRLGEGGMAVVYLAEDLKHGRRVAIKVLRPDLASDLGADRFLREIRIAAGLSHPNILPLFDSGDADGHLYFVMPYVDGPTLGELMTREGPLPVEEVVRIVAQIGSALHRAHAAGVVHRDIKPENVLLESGQALVADFGVARAVDAAGGDRLTRTGLAIGTPIYMSPEQAMSSPEQDERSDLYSLGCLAYEMLVGAPPFDGSTAHAVIAAHLAKPVPPILSRRPDVPPGLARAVERALAKDPARRYETVVAMVDAITAAVTAAGRVAERRRAVRRRAGVTGVAVLVAAGTALGGWWLADRMTAPAIERIAVLPASNMTRDPEQAFFVDGVHEALVSELQRAGISVIARQSVLRYRDSDAPIDQIARELGVDALLQPAVGREGDSVVVDLGLFDGRTQLPIWSASFVAESRGVLGLYRDVSARVAEQIGAALSSEAEARLAERPLVDPQVVEAVYAGQFHLRRFTPQDFDLALGYFERALALDSMYAPAHLGVASVWGYRSQARLMPPREARALLLPHLARTLELDPTLPRARFMQAAQTVWGDCDIVEGERLMREALALDPDEAEHRVFYGHVLMIQGRYEEAIAEGERAMRDDPLNPFVTGLHGVLLNAAGRTAETIPLMTELLQRNPGAGFGVGPLLNALEREGRFAQALEVRKGFQSRFPGVADALDAGFAEGGYPEATRRAADRLAELFEGGVYVSGYELAGTYVQAGRSDLAIDWLRVAVEQEDPNLPYLGSSEMWQPLHDEPGFRAIVEELGFELHEPAP